MLYKDINKEVARQCCKEHTVFNDKKHKERVCDNCHSEETLKMLTEISEEAFVGSS